MTQLHNRQEPEERKLARTKIEGALQRFEQRNLSPFDRKILVGLMKKNFDDEEDEEGSKELESFQIEADATTPWRRNPINAFNSKKAFGQDFKEAEEPVAIDQHRSTDQSEEQERMFEPRIGSKTENMPRTQSGKSQEQKRRDFSERQKQTKGFQKKIRSIIKEESKHKRKFRDLDKESED